MQKVLPPNPALVPDNAIRVFKGEIFDVYQWPQKLFDGRTATFEMLKRPDTVQILLARDNRLLLIIDEQPGHGPRLKLPMGRTDDEDPSWLPAAQRELREETGFICANWRLVFVEQPIDKVEWFTPLFLAQDITDELPRQLDPGGEKIELVWKDFDDVRGIALSAEETTMNYMQPFFRRVKTMDELLALQAFAGKEVSR